MFCAAYKENEFTHRGFPKCYVTPNKQSVYESY